MNISYFFIVLSSEPTCAVAEGGMLLLGIIFLYY